VSTISLKGSRNRVVRGIRLVSSDVDTDLDPGKETILDAITKVQVLWVWVIVVLGLHDGPHVVGVGGDGLGVGGVWVCGFDGRAEGFLPEELADVGDAAALNGSVGHDSHVAVREKMGVDGTAVVVAWEDGLE